MRSGISAAALQPKRVSFRKEERRRNQIFKYLKAAKNFFNYSQLKSGRFAHGRWHAQCLSRPVLSSGQKCISSILNKQKNGQYCLAKERETVCRAIYSKWNTLQVLWIPKFGSVCNIHCVYWNFQFEIQGNWMQKATCNQPTDVRALWFIYCGFFGVSHCASWVNWPNQNLPQLIFSSLSSQAIASFQLATGVIAAPESGTRIRHQNQASPENGWWWKKVVASFAKVVFLIF